MLRLIIYNYLSPCEPVCEAVVQQNRSELDS
uniref:Uncharacterized protein n=1 Tax=Anguilla anguilla TaxID=7936 RepID=A0A0E9WFP6_ANGAN